MTDEEDDESPNRGPYRDGQVHVMAERCSSCVFRPGNLMSLNPGRLADMVHQNRRLDTAFACHQTLYREDVDQAVCRGYYDAYGDEVTPLRLARVIGIIAEDPQPPERH